MTDNTITINHDRLFETMSKYFGGTQIAVNEVLQNAYRACFLLIAEGKVPEIELKLDQDELTVGDPGRGIDNIARALSLAESNWEAAVEQQQHPAGMGLCGLLANCRELYVASNFGSLVINSKGFFEDPEYRATLPSLVQPDDKPEGGTRVTLRGIRANAFAECLASSVGWYRDVEFRQTGTVALRGVRDVYAAPNVEQLGEVFGMPLHYSAHGISPTKEPEIVVNWYGQPVNNCARGPYHDVLYLTVSPSHPAPTGFAPLLPNRLSMQKNDKYKEIQELVYARVRSHQIAQVLDRFQKALDARNGDQLRLWCDKRTDLPYVQNAIYEKFGYLQLTDPDYLLYGRADRYWARPQHDELLTLSDLDIEVVTEDGRELMLEEYDRVRVLSWDNMPANLYRYVSEPKSLEIPVTNTTIRLTVSNDAVGIDERYVNRTELELLPLRVPISKLELVDMEDRVRYTQETPSMVWYDREHGAFRGQGDERWLRDQVADMVSNICEHHLDISEDSDYSDIKQEAQESANQLLVELGNYAVFDPFSLGIPVPWFVGDKIEIDTKNDIIRITPRETDPEREVQEYKY